MAIHTCAEAPVVLSAPVSPDARITMAREIRLAGGDLHSRVKNLPPLNQEPGQSRQ
jgi:hypothetical protein